MLHLSIICQKGMASNSSQNHLPFFMQDSQVKPILQEVIDSIPKGTKLYLIGGVARNAVYYQFFSDLLPQRDYDLILIGDKNKFIKNLEKRGFEFGKIRREGEVVLMKPKFPGATELSDHVVLDIYIPPEKDILRNLKENANFTISGFALPVNSFNSPNWFSKIIALPRSFKDLRSKQLRVNSSNYPTNIFACLRFMSQGFNPPPPGEVRELLQSLGSIGEGHFNRAVQKVFDYVGGEERARELMQELGIKGDLFNYQWIRDNLS